MLGAVVVLVLVVLVAAAAVAGHGVAGRAGRVGRCFEHMATTVVGGIFGPVEFCRVV